jgi:3',5'-cyclic AMP phosphodiesterase CpdA
MSINTKSPVFIPKQKSKSKPQTIVVAPVIKFNLTKPIEDNEEKFVIQILLHHKKFIDWTKIDELKKTYNIPDTTRRNRKNGNYEAVSYRAHHHIPDNGVQIITKDEEIGYEIYIDNNMKRLIITKLRGNYHKFYYTFDHHKVMYPIFYDFGYGDIKFGNSIDYDGVERMKCFIH